MQRVAVWLIVVVVGTMLSVGGVVAAGSDATPPATDADGWSAAITDAEVEVASPTRAEMRVASSTRAEMRVASPVGTGIGVIRVASSETTGTGDEQFRRSAVQSSGDNVTVFRGNGSVFQRADTVEAVRRLQSAERLHPTETYAEGNTLVVAVRSPRIVDRLEGVQATNMTAAWFELERTTEFRFITRVQPPPQRPSATFALSPRNTTVLLDEGNETVVFLLDTGNTTAIDSFTEQPVDWFDDGGGVEVGVRIPTGPDEYRYLEQTVVQRTSAAMWTETPSTLFGSARPKLVSNGTRQVAVNVSTSFLPGTPVTVQLVRLPETRPADSAFHGDFGRSTELSLANRTVVASVTRSVAAAAPFVPPADRSPYEQADERVVPRTDSAGFVARLNIQNLTVGDEFNIVVRHNGSVIERHPVSVGRPPVVRNVNATFVRGNDTRPFIHHGTTDGYVRVTATVRVPDDGLLVVSKPDAFDSGFTRSVPADQWTTVTVRADSTVIAPINDVSVRLYWDVDGDDRFDGNAQAQGDDDGDALFVTTTTAGAARWHGEIRDIVDINGPETPPFSGFSLSDNESASTDESPPTDTPPSEPGSSRTDDSPPTDRPSNETGTTDESPRTDSASGDAGRSSDATTTTVPGVNWVIGVVCLLATVRMLARRRGTD